MKYCKACGYRVPEEADACPLCGGRLSAAPGAPSHTHREPGERCVLPNREPPRPAAPRETLRRPTVRDRSRRTEGSPLKTLWAVLTVVFVVSALPSLGRIFLGGDLHGLGGLIGSLIMAQLFYRLFTLPPGAKAVTDRTGKATPLGLYALPRVIFAALFWAFF